MSLFYLFIAPAPPPAIPKPKVFVNKQPPIVINRKAQSYTINAGSPVIVKPAPVVIQRPGSSEYVPTYETVTAAPIIVTKKIIKVDRPIIERYVPGRVVWTLPCIDGKRTLKQKLSLG